jgi:hypothetical protein
MAEGGADQNVTSGVELVGDDLARCKIRAAEPSYGSGHLGLLGVQVHHIGNR